MEISLQDGMQEVIDTALASVHPGTPSAKLYTNTGGMPLFGYSHKELPRAAIEYARLIERHDFAAASALVGNLRVTFDIEEFASWVVKGVYTKSLVEFAAQAATKYSEYRGRHLTDSEMALILYAEFTGKDLSEIKAIVDNAESIYAENWSRTGGDQEDPPAEVVQEFYRTLPFPIGSNLHRTVESHLGMAIRAQPVLLAKSAQAKRVIDIGGNDGLVTSAMAAAGIPVVTLVEENGNSLAFAKWRDQIAGIKGVEYLRAADSMGTLNGRTAFDLAVCTEVLEHLPDVEGFLRMLAKLVGAGGLLFLSASFGLRQPSHLLSNRKYFGHERELLARHGFERCELRTPIGLNNVWLFRRT
jgi:2-polyprenyl-3-methyl-5-hydroxy-6-metoxy-1,4-benzoquinol methylase